MGKGMRYVHIGQQSPQQIGRTDDLARALKGFELHGLLLQMGWQARNDLLAPLILPTTSLRNVLCRRMMLLIWHVVSPGTWLRELF
jgi:hypothetical protein